MCLCCLIDRKHVPHYWPQLCSVVPTSSPEPSDTEDQTVGGIPYTTHEDDDGDLVMDLLLPSPTFEPTHETSPISLCETDEETN